MKMDKEQLERFLQHLKDKFKGGPTCPLCGHKVWTAEPYILQALIYSPKGLTIGGPVLPFLAIRCMNCSNMQFINAVSTGILSIDEPKQPAPAEAGKEAEK